MKSMYTSTTILQRISYGSELQLFGGITKTADLE